MKEFPSGILKNFRQLQTTITHKKITEPNFIIFELFSVIPFLWLLNRLFLELMGLGK